MQKRLILTAFTCFAILAGGCDPAMKKAFVVEFTRNTFTTELGPVVLTSIVFASVPAGSPSALSALCTDRTWGCQFVSTRLDSTLTDPIYVPSMFEWPDPRRPVKITSVPVAK